MKQDPPGFRLPRFTLTQGSLSQVWKAPMCSADTNRNTHHTPKAWWIVRLQTAFKCTALTPGVRAREHICRHHFKLLELERPEVKQMVQGHNGDPAWVASWRVQTYNFLLPVQIFSHQAALPFLYLFLNRIFIYWKPASLKPELNQPPKLGQLPTSSRGY